MDFISKRLQKYNPKSLLDEENAIKEIYQEIALCGLAGSGFFDYAAFQGGTCLRIIHNLNRFSEDLDFTLINTSTPFTWTHFLDRVKFEFSKFGLDLNVIEAKESNKAIKRAILKDSSFTRVLELKYPRDRSHRQVINIKFELDVIPPEFSKYEKVFLNFPSTFSLIVQDMPSLFAGKCHALLCRPFLKGRDWFDFLWYMRLGSTLNLKLLKASLIQTKHWTDGDIELTYDKVADMLDKKIKSIEWDEAKKDLYSLLKQQDLGLLNEWNVDMFLYFSKQLRGYPPVSA